MRTPDGAGFVSIAYELTGDALAVEVVDDGKGFDPERPPALEGEELTEGGLGIAIIRTIADEFELQSQPGCPRLAAALREAAAPAGLTVVNIDNDAAEAPRRLQPRAGLVRA